MPADDLKKLRRRVENCLNTCDLPGYAGCPRYALNDFAMGGFLPDDVIQRLRNYFGGILFIGGR